MKKSTVTMVGFLAALACGSSHAAEWGYAGQQHTTPPNQWHKISPTCGSIKQQSPINIIDSEALDSKISVTTHYKTDLARYQNNGHAVVVDIAKLDNRRWIELNMEKNGQPQTTAYDLQQLHFHSLSEHSFSATRKHTPYHYDMELHLIHANQEGELVVIGVPIQQGKHNEALAELFDGLAQGYQQGGINMFADVGELLPKNNNNVFIYDGSLTTPPCSEGVKWVVFAEPIEMSAKQIETYRGLFSENGERYHTHRPTQKLNSLMTNMLKWRKVYIGTVNN